MPPKSKSARFLFLTGVIICGVVVSSHYYGSVSTVPEDPLGGLGFGVKSERGNEGEISPSSSQFNWSNVTPSKDLNWVPCFTERQCASLLVPMDHLSPSGIQGAIALIRKPSPLGSDHPDYRGPILFNPGGPGGSGIQLLIGSGDQFAKIVGPQFDLVSFDPRGVGASIPRASFYKSNFERVIWDNALRVIHDADVSRLWAKMKVINAMTVENDDGNLRYINTDQTARDMLSIVHAHGREKLQYWGLSYGTVLGSTFAAMFPDKVERLIIDGVCDAEDYYATLWSKNLMDTDKGIDLFVSGCHEAGPGGCHFWAPTNAAIRHNMTNLFDRVRREPVPVSSPMGPHAVVDIDMLERIVFAALYTPYAVFPLLAEAFAALAHGDGSILLSIVGVVDSLDCPAESQTELVSDATAAILCNDGEEIPSDLESTQKYFAMMKRSSPTWGPIWAGIRMNCIDWPKFPKTNFRGPFNATTSHPLLVIGNTADPVAPLWAAKKMSAGFTDSVVLTQDSPGHCSIGAPSTCTQNYIRKYFIDGTLPKPGTICPADTPIFGGQHVVPSGSAHKAFSSLSVEEQDIYIAIQELSKKDALKAMNFPILRGFL
ncbi:TAP-like protein-domain-containing protein [Panaeolus papilionaceus]|nr:TAP-like protein-domain-containing protein [Panaeolus papilionaceus]